MKFKSWILLLYTIRKVSSNSSCSRLDLSDEFNVFSGEYISQFEHNGNPQYFRSDGKFNLFSSKKENGCEWKISNLEENFPFTVSNQNNCETLTVESKFLVWETFSSENETRTNEILIKCICPSKDEFTILKISILVIIILSSIFLLILMHVNIRKRRILKATNECKICKNREETLHNLNVTNSASV